MVKIKVCGICSPYDIDQISSLGGISYLGMVFYNKSPRFVDNVIAGEISQEAKGKFMRVGVLVNPSNNDIEKILKDVDLDIIQLHGDESPLRVLEIENAFPEHPLIKAIPISDENDIPLIKEYENSSDIILCDTKLSPDKHGNKTYGGTGVSFDSAFLASLSWTKPWFVAGGLNPDNVGAVVSKTRPFGVDVSSGVESSPGVKDFKKIAAFVKQVEEASLKNFRNEVP